MYFGDRAEKPLDNFITSVSTLDMMRLCSLSLASKFDQIGNIVKETIYGQLSIVF